MLKRGESWKVTGLVWKDKARCRRRKRAVAFAPGNEVNFHPFSEFFCFFHPKENEKNVPPPLL